MPQKAAKVAKAVSQKEHALEKRLQYITQSLEKLKPDNALSPKDAELYAPSDMQPARSTWSAAAPKHVP